MTAPGNPHLRELAARSDEPYDDVERWFNAGLLTSREPSNVEAERVRLIGTLQRHGVPLELIEQAFRDHRQLIDDFAAQTASAEPITTIAARGEITIPDRVREAISDHLGDALRAPTAEDISVLRTMSLVLDRGFPEEALAQLIRVYSDAMDRVADAETRLFHLHVHQALREDGLSGQELTDATAGVSSGLEDLIEPTLMYFHRKSWQRAMRYDFVIHVLEELGIEAADSRRGQMQRAVLFVDLSSFTPLTTVMGDVTAAGVLDRFSSLVRHAARQQDGTVVKQIGDGFMLVFLDPISAVRSALALCKLVLEEPHFPAVHAGVHYGPVLYREGDYIGATVNIAARLLSVAGPQEIVLTASARRHAREQPDIAFHPLGNREIRGIDEPLEVYRVESATAPTQPRRTDPICGMQLRESEIAARITIGHDDYVFCSRGCLGRFAGRK